MPTISVDASASTSQVSPPVRKCLVPLESLSPTIPFAFQASMEHKYICKHCEAQFNQFVPYLIFLPILLIIFNFSQSSYSYHGTVTCPVLHPLASRLVSSPPRKSFTCIGSYVFISCSYALLLLGARKGKVQVFCTRMWRIIQLPTEPASTSQTNKERVPQVCEMAVREATFYHERYFGKGISYILLHFQTVASYQAFMRPDKNSLFAGLKTMCGGSIEVVIHGSNESLALQPSVEY